MRFILVDLVLRCRLNPEKVVRMILPMGTLMAFQHGTHKTHTRQTKSVLFIPLCVSFFMFFAFSLSPSLTLLSCSFFYTESNCFNTTRKTGLEQIDMKTSSKRKLARAFFELSCLLLLIGSYCKSFFSASQRSFRLDICKAINDLCAITCYI